MKDASVPWGDPALRIKSVDVVEEDLGTVVRQMVDYSFQIHLPAVCGPEIGIYKRVVVLNSWYGQPFNNREKVLVMLNPKIQDVFGEQHWMEECHCIPDQRFRMTRPWRCRVGFFDEGMIWRVRSLQDEWAGRVFHALDHFQGALIVDRVSPTKRRAAMSTFLPGMRRHAED